MSLSQRRTFDHLRNNDRKRDICFCLLLFVFTTEASKRLGEDHNSHSESTGYTTYDDTSEDELQEEQTLPPFGDVDSRLYIVINFPAWDDCIATYPTSIQVAHLMSYLQGVRIACFTHSGKAIDR